MILVLLVIAALIVSWIEAFSAFKIYEDKGGWFRITPTGPGFNWIRSSEPMLYSERHGHKYYFTAFGWRVRYLQRWPR